MRPSHIGTTLVLLICSFYLGTQVRCGGQQTKLATVFEGLKEGSNLTDGWRTKPKCKGVDDVIPWKSVEISTGYENSTYRWVPENCVLDWMPDAAARKCLKQFKPAGVGDSIAMNHVAAGWKMLKNLRFEQIKDVSSVSPFTDQAKELREARPRLIIFSQGIWDIGMHYCGVSTFYKNVKQKLLAYKSVVPPDTAFVYHNLQYLNGTNTWAKSCNPRAKVELFREAIALAASCTNVTLFTSYDYAASRPSESGDGVHYGYRIQLMKLHIIAQMLCNGLEPPRAPYRCTPALEEQLLAKWDVDLANRKSKRCPQVPDVCKDITDEAARVQGWTRN
eukprot:TRINITY_DN3632_c5_g1_i1.p1 TRINITY_DN3632_c5_g1~~TRINITY_DN3632_c5_g1_i1.p1  ORF type:complete len:334 (+),score=40.68 TRINITY_DN3632_c5_g1_i1:155-1156(+)